MRRAFVLLGAVAVVAGGLDLAQDSATARAPATIKLDDDFYSPDFNRIRKGRLVEFRWVGNDEHNVTKARGPGRDFSSTTTDVRGVNFTRRFRKAGRFRIMFSVK
jgi:plastocyanin